MVGVRNYPASGGRDGMWGGSGMDRKANNNGGMKETEKFLEREIGVRSK